MRIHTRDYAAEKSSFRDQATGQRQREMNGPRETSLHSDEG